MAQFLTTDEIRNYPLSNGETADLAALVDNAANALDLNQVTRDEVKIGDAAYVDAMGGTRRGVVVKVTKTKIHVAFTTQGAIDESARSAGYGAGYTRGIRVQITVADMVYVKAALAPVAAVAVETPVPLSTETELAQTVIEADHSEALTLHSQDGKVVLVSENENWEPEMTTTEIQNHTGSTVVTLLEKVWARIRENHPELPEVVIITGSGLLAGSKWGHFRADGWNAEEGRKHELFLAGEALAKGASQVLQTMIHEAAHTICKVRGIQDTSRQGRWHNAEFKKAAAELGLEHKSSSADKSHGFSFVTLTDTTKATYADLLEELEREIKLTCHLPSWLGGSADQDEEKGGEKITGGKALQGEDDKKASGPIKATCNCEEPNIIRASKKVLDKKTISCDDCDSIFLPADEK